MASSLLPARKNGPFKVKKETMNARLKFCPCGSGKRFKKCCGQLAAISDEDKVENRRVESPAAVSRQDSQITGESGTTVSSLSQTETRSQYNMSIRKENMVIALFQTASGSWHIQSILIVVGWLVTGALLFVQLSANRIERLNSFKKEKQYINELEKSGSKIIDLESQTKEIPILQGRISEQVKKINEVYLKNKSRSISDEQVNRIISKLKNVSKPHVELIYSSSDQEAKSYGDQIHKLLTSAGYTTNLIRAFTVIGSQPGVTLSIKDRNNPPPGSNELLSVFNEFGILCIGLDGSENNGEIVISVGAKPI